jgi:hypothetical protein
VYNQELQNRNIELHERISTLEGEIQVLKRAEREQKLELAHLKEKEVTFRDIIISKAGSQKITEEEVITAYSVLRQQVQALARNPAYQVEKAPSVPLSSSSKMKHFYAIWKKGLSSKDLGFRIRAQIFSLLDQNILGKCCFGLDIDATQNPQFKGYREIERSLQDFEDILAKSKGLLPDPKRSDLTIDFRIVSGTSIADWRISTLECIGLLKLPDDYSGWVADKVYDFLNPLISATTKKVREDLWNVILEVCRRAFRLRMLMRMSKEGYACVVPDLKDVCVLSKMEHFAESFGVEGGKAEDRSDEVAYVLFGALTKDSRHLGGDRKVLEKAQVILKRR